MPDNRLILKHNFNHNGPRTEKMTLTQKPEYLQVWISFGEKNCGIRLDEGQVKEIIEFLKNKC